jgi:GTP-binding protein
VLLHLVDASASDPASDLEVVEAELRAYGHGLADKPRLLVLTKAELLDEDQREQAMEALRGLQQEKPAPLMISAVTGEGLNALLRAVWQCLAIED